MNNSSYNFLSKKILEEIFDIADNLGLDVEENNGILEINLPDQRQFLVNQHNPTSQIWLSSPISGAYHFVYNQESSNWICTRTQKELKSIIISELEQLNERK